VHSLNRFVFSVPDLGEARRFFSAFGLDVRDHGDRIDLHTYGHPHCWGSVHGGGAVKRLEYISFSIDAPDLAARNLASRRFANDIRRHVDDISKKYLIPGETAEGALMFLPSEAIHAALLASHGDLFAEAARRGVHIVGPSSFWAVLNTMRGLLRDARLQDEARRIRHEVEALAEETARLERRVGALRSHYAGMAQDMRDIEITAEKIARRGEAIRALDIPDAPTRKAAE
jgi:DNA recombination protein RmuC